MTRDIEPALELIKRFEGLGDGDPQTPALEPYLCPAGYWTIGYGHVIRNPIGRGPLRGIGKKAAALRIQGSITLAQAEALLRDDASTVAAALERFVRVKINDNQFCALLSFAFNVGIAALARSTLLRRLNAGDGYAVPKELARWTKAGTKTLPGLVRRREAEATLWNTEVI